MSYTKARKSDKRKFHRAKAQSKNNFGRGFRKGRAKSNLDLEQIVNRVGRGPRETDSFSPARSFQELNLDAKLKENITKMGFVNPTEIQEKTLKPEIRGRDLVGVANTGTGKTAAFLIPIIDQLTNGKPFSSLVIVPTRELALQVEKEFKCLTNGMGLYSASFIGGTSVGRDVHRLRRRHHLIIGTPGRLMDLTKRKALNLQDFSVLILDEFDRMLDMGFVNDIKKIVGGMKYRRQTMLFSATTDKTQKSLIDTLLTNPINISVGPTTNAAARINQDLIKVPKGGDKFNMLLDLVSGSEYERVLIFAETKRLVDKVSQRLNKSGVSAALIHGNKSQNYRIQALDKFRKGKVQVLVATDVAARGIDVDNVTHVINYEKPQTLDSYIHRIGRTGRAGKAGKAVTFVN